MTSPFRVGTDALLGDQLWSIPMPVDDAVVVEERRRPLVSPIDIVRLDAKIAALEGRLATLEARTISAIYRRCLAWIRSLWRRV
jgi:hypothetical protein